MISFFAHSITILSTVFALGGVTYLFIRFHTHVLKMVLLFLLSLLLISIGFWFNTSPVSGLAAPGSGMEIFLWIVRLLGSGLNIIILPYLVSALVSVPIIRPLKGLLWSWNGLFIILALTFFLFPDFQFLSRVRPMFHPVTILGALLFGTVCIRRVKNRWWRKALVTFFLISFLFLLLLVLDILISVIPIRILEPVDNLSLPVYLIALSAGTFYFAGTFLSKDPLLKNGKLTENCLKFYKLTPREAGIIEELILGKTNKEIGEKLYISVKTVENHLYNIYQKIDVTNRLQLLHTLNTWSSS